MPHRYTLEQDKFLRDNVSGRSIMELTELFNRQFSLNLKYSQIRAYAKNRKLRCGIDCRFKKRNIPPHKGKKGVHISNATQFKPGNIPYNYKPVGSEVINTEGYVIVKVSDYGNQRNRWRHKHIIIWESVNGLLQKGEVIIFGDGDKTNLDVNNLIKVSRRELAILNKKQLIKDNADLTRTGILIADVILKANEVKRRKAK